jgi:hypothetical protein
MKKKDKLDDTFSTDLTNTRRTFSPDMTTTDYDNKFCKKVLTKG